MHVALETLPRLAGAGGGRLLVRGCPTGDAFLLVRMAPMEWEVMGRADPEHGVTDENLSWRCQHEANW